MLLCMKKTFFSITDDASWPSWGFVIDCWGAIVGKTLALTCCTLSLNPCAQAA